MPIWRCCPRHRARGGALARENDSIELVVADADGNAPEALEAVRAFLDARRDVTVPLTIAEPRPVEYRVSLALDAIRPI